jgi:ribonucleoside-diphosphate reductase alpha chain
MSDLSNDYNFVRLAREGETTWQDIFDRFKTEMLKRGTRLSKEDLDWLMDNAYALPNSPALLTAGDPKGMFGSACSSYPIFDTMRGHPFAILNSQGIAEDATCAGIGIGFNFSRLRSSQETVRGRKNITGGPVSFLRKFSGSIGEITQATRKSACMGAISVHHPDVRKFIACKREDGKIANFNLSLIATDEFMKAVEADGEYEIRPAMGEPYREKARPIFDMACEFGYLYGGEPAWLFHGNIERDYFQSWKPEDILPNPCQPGFATVLTPEGIRTFDEIDAGSVIWSGKQWTKVVRKWSTGVKPVYEFDTPAGVFVGTDNHKVISDGVRVPAGMAEYFDVALCDDVQLTYKDCRPQDVMDGLVLGDGGIHKASNNLIILYIGDKDGDYHQSEIAPLIGAHRPGIGPKVWEIDSTIVPKDLVYTYDRIIPDRFYKGDAKTKIGFLRGLFTANGCVTAGRVQYKGASYTLVRQIQDMLSSLGIQSSLVINKPATIEHRNGKYTSRESYNLILYRSSHRFMKMIGFLQQYKNDARLSPTPCKVFGNKKRTKTSLGEMPVFDIEVDAPEHTYWTGGLLVSNCAEALLTFGQDKSGRDWLELCVLLSLNLPRYVELPADDRRRAVTLSVRLLNDIIDGQDYVSEYHRIGMQEVNRKIGIGYAGLATVLAVKRLKYSSQEGREYMAALQREIAEYALAASQELGDVNGLGRYNTSLFSVAPTSTLSNIFAHFNPEGCSYGIEPYFGLELTVRNSYGTFQKKEKIVDFLNGDVAHIECANDLDWQGHVKMVEAVMKAAPQGTFQSCSKTLNFKENVSFEEYKEAVIYCWKHGIKGVSLYRDQSREGQVLSTGISKSSDGRPKCIEYRSAPHRPESLECDIHHLTYQGQKWIVLVGCMCGKPFEVFAGLEENIALPKKHKTGRIVATGKKGSRRYNLHVGEGEDEIVIRDIPKSFDNPGFGTWTRTISLSLRHGVPVQYLCEQLVKTEEFTSFLRMVARILKKYIAEGASAGEACDCGGKLTYVSGCQTCLSCGKSKCG